MSKNEIKVIEEREVLGQAFKMYGTLETPLFLSKDVAEWIEHTKPSVMLQSVDEEEKLRETLFTSGQKREVLFLTEDGLYEVLMQSRKPIAKAFKKQVKEILKELRRNGHVDFRNKETIKNQLAEAKLRNSRAREASLLVKIAQMTNNDTYKQVLISKSAQVLNNGELLLPLPKLERRTYSAEDIGRELGISANMVGRLANQFKLKTDEYGQWVWDKSRSSNKQVESFRYYDTVLNKLNEVMGVAL